MLSSCFSSAGRVRHQVAHLVQGRADGGHGRTLQVKVNLMSSRATRDDPLTIGEVAARSGARALGDPLLRVGGVDPRERTDSGRRAFRRHVLRRLAFISSAQRVGLTLKEIADALATLPPDRAPTKAQWARLSRGWRGRLDERITELERCATICRRASAAGACRCRRADCSTRTTRPPRTDRARATSSATIAKRSDVTRCRPRPPPRRAGRPSRSAPTGTARARRRRRRAPALRLRTDSA